MFVCLFVDDQKWQNECSDDIHNDQMKGRCGVTGKMEGAIGREMRERRWGSEIKGRGHRFAFAAKRL